MPTALMNTGFEHGLHSVSGQGLFNALTGTAPTIATDQIRNGAYSLKCALPTSAYQSSNRPPIWAASSRLVFRFGFRYSGNPSVQIVIAEMSAGGIFPRIVLTTNGELRAATSGGTPSDGSVISITPNAWHLVEWVVDMNQTAYRHRIKVDGTENATDATATGSGAGSVVQFNIGVTGSVTLSVARDLWFDDLIVGSTATALTGGVAFTDYWGDGKGIWIIPGSDGTHSFTANDFSTGDAGTLRAPSYTDFWQMVDDPAPWVTARSTTDNITQRVIRNTGYVEIKPATTALTGETANAVRAFMAYSSTAATANTAACIIRNSTPVSTTIWGTHTGIGGGSDALTDHSEVTNFFKSAIVTPPAAGWTKSEIEALRWRVGAAGDISPVPTWQFLALEVDYPIISAPAENPLRRKFIRNEAAHRASRW